MQRRNFLKTAAATGGLTILRSGLLRGQAAPSNRLKYSAALPQYPGLWLIDATVPSGVSGQVPLS
jgi:TAT (twin-arginine translocation) pathway signal sequence